MSPSAKYFLLLPLALFSLAVQQTAIAETIKIPVGQQKAAQHIAKPQMGLSMEQVEAKFGDPRKRNPAKGEPPITRWEYEQFVVYFESNTVIHSVIRHKPTQNTDQLQP